MPSLAELIQKLAEFRRRFAGLSLGLAEIHPKLAESQKKGQPQFEIAYWLVVPIAV